MFRKVTGFSATTHLNSKISFYYVGIYKKLRKIMLCGGLTLIVVSGFEKCDDPKQRTSLERVGSGTLNAVHKCITYTNESLDWVDKKVVEGREYLRGKNGKYY